MGRLQKAMHTITKNEYRLKKINEEVGQLPQAIRTTSRQSQLGWIGSETHSALEAEEVKSAVRHPYSLTPQSQALPWAIRFHFGVPSRPGFCTQGTSHRHPRGSPPTPGVALEMEPGRLEPK